MLTGLALDARRVRRAAARYEPRLHVALALDGDQPARLQDEAPRLQHLRGLLRHLDHAHAARRVHAGRLVHGVAPHVEHGLPRADDAADQRAAADACPITLVSAS